MNTLKISVFCTTVDAGVPESLSGITFNTAVVDDMVSLTATLDTGLSDVELRAQLMDGAAYAHPECALIGVINTNLSAEELAAGRVPFMQCAMPHVKG